MMKEFKFPGGEWHVVLDEKDFKWRYGTVTAHFDLWSADDILKMLLHCEVLRSNTYEFNITIPYVPYARQDRHTTDLEPFSIKVMTDLINSIGAKTVTIYDPHSDVTSALINNVKIKEQHDIISTLFNHVGQNSTIYSGIIAPDTGASKKALKVAQKFSVPLYQAHKVRDTKTGEISATRLLENLPDPFGTYLVPDDICDGGRTFVELAKVIRDKYPSVIFHLYVTHGIFSKGIDELLDHYSKIFCVNVKDKGRFSDYIELVTY